MLSTIGGGVGGVEGGREGEINTVYHLSEEEEAEAAAASADVTSLFGDKERGALCDNSHNSCICCLL